MEILLNVAGTYMNPANVTYLVDVSDASESMTSIHFVDGKSVTVKRPPNEVAGIINQYGK